MAQGPFSPRSGRYAQVPTTTTIGADRLPVVYLTRRFVPQPERHVLISEHAVHAGERLDHIAARYLGDPELFWRLCDANRATDPVLLEQPGLRIRITLPAELSDTQGTAGDATGGQGGGVA